MNFRKNFDCTSQYFRFLLIFYTNIISSNQLSKFHLMPKIITDPEIKLCKKTMDVYLREYFEEEKRKYKFEKPVGPPNLVNRG